MARLNEPPTSIESIESLKRRFIRQNRDLARANSTQSLKIRQQEGEIAHLLSENASLRQRILQLENELALSAEDDLRGNVDVVRARLEKQLDDFVGQVGRSLFELGELKRKKKTRRKSTEVKSPKRSPARKEWRNSSTLCEILASQGQTMPTIVEDKLFPRKTLDVSEIERARREAELELETSPEMERPVTFLDRTSPQKKDSNSEEEAASNIFAGVEIRKRRRQSSLLANNDNTDSSIHPLKAGAKRKLGMAENKEDKSPQKPLTVPRVPLGEKAVNTDPVVSPVKTRQIATKKEALPATIIKAPATKKSAAPPVPQIQSKQPLEVAIIDEDVPIKLEPTTPAAGLDLFSPPSTQPSASSPERARPATPPPGSADASGSMRGSRRAKAAVSYAEPKLNVKMRRPGKEMADAVTGKREGSIDGSEGGAKVVHIKKEGSVTRSVTPVETAANRAMSPSAGRERVVKSVEDTNAPAAKAGSKVIEEKKKSQVSVNTKALEDIFTVNSTPPPEEPVRALAAATRQASTSSTTSQSSNRSATSTSTAAQPDRKSPTEVNIGTGSLRRARRQTVSSTESAAEKAAASAALRKSTVTIGMKDLQRTKSSANLASDENKDASATTALRRTNSTASMSTVRAERAARIAERRKSMMV